MRGYRWKRGECAAAAFFAECHFHVAMLRWHQLARSPADQFLPRPSVRVFGFYIQVNNSPIQVLDDDRVGILDDCAEAEHHQVLLRRLLVPVHGPPRDQHPLERAHHAPDLRGAMAERDVLK